MLWSEKKKAGDPAVGSPAAKQLAGGVGEREAMGLGFFGCAG